MYVKHDIITRHWELDGHNTWIKVPVVVWHLSQKGSILNDLACIVRIHFTARKLMPHGNYTCIHYRRFNHICLYVTKVLFYTNAIWFFWYSFQGVCKRFNEDHWKCIKYSLTTNSDAIFACMKLLPMNVPLTVPRPRCDICMCETSSNERSFNGAQTTPRETVDLKHLIMHSLP